MVNGQPAILLEEDDAVVERAVPWSGLHSFVQAHDDGRVEPACSGGQRALLTAHYHTVGAELCEDLLGCCMVPQGCIRRVIQPGG